MPYSPRRGPRRITSFAFGAIPVAFGLIRAITTRHDFRYVWLAAAALLGSILVTSLVRPASGGRAGLGLAISAVAAGAASAAATAIVLGATAGPAVAIVSLAFGLCTGTSAVLGLRARQVPS